MNTFLRGAFRNEDGFTLTEAMVALVIIFGLMVVLLRTFDSGTRVLVETRRQAAASKLASELIERAQALEWQHMGLAVSNSGDDCPTEQIGCYIGTVDGLAGGAGSYTLDGEEVVFSNADTFAPFLSFHTTEDRGGTLFDRYLFVTSIIDPVSLAETERRLVAIVQWVPPSGFRREVRLETKVSEFREPSQPLIGGEIFYSGGNFVFNHRDDVLLDGSGVDGTQGWVFSTDPDVLTSPLVVDFSHTPRPAIEGLVLMPQLRMNAVSDFVSGTDMQLTGTNVAELKWDGVPAVFPVPNTVLESTDDDASSLPPLNIDPITLFANSLEGYNHAGLGLEDLVVAETTSGLDLRDVPTDPADKTGIDEHEYSAELWTQNVGDLPVEDPPLPNAKFDHEFEGGPDEIVVGFTEYESGYFSSEPFYDFRLYRRGLADEAIHLEARLDRDNDITTGNRTISGRLEFAGDEIRLFDDDAYPGKGSGKNNSFNGFIQILTPEIHVNQVEAGEGVLTVPALVTVGDLVIRLWDPFLGPAGGYVEARRIDYDTLGGVCGAGAVDHIPVSIFDSIRKSGHPYIDYQVEGDIFVHGWCSNVEFDALGSVSEAFVQTNGPMVTGDIRYTVTDVWLREFFASNPGVVAGSWSTYAPGEMTVFDVNAHFETDELRVTTVFVDPNAG